MIYLELLIGFLKVGCFAFGGAYSAIPLIRDVVLSYGWLSDERLTDMIAVSESTPGPIMVNLATYVGSSQAGLFGALIATLAVVTPSCLIILLLTILLKTALKNKYAAAVLGGAQAVRHRNRSGDRMCHGVPARRSSPADRRRGFPPADPDGGAGAGVFRIEKDLEEGTVTRRPDPDFRLCGDRDVRRVRDSDDIRFFRRGYRKDGVITNIPLYLARKTRKLL